MSQHNNTNTNSNILEELELGDGYLSNPGAGTLLYAIQLQRDCHLQPLDRVPTSATRTMLDPPEGFLHESLPAKVLYTCDKNMSQKFLAKPRSPVPVYAHPVELVAVIDLDACLSAVLQNSPELADPQECADYSLYSRDFSEQDSPLLGHGRLSELIHGSKKWISGRLCSTPLCARMLEVEIHLSPLGPPPSISFQAPPQQRRDLHARREWSAPALTFSDDILTSTAASTSTIHTSPGATSPLDVAVHDAVPPSSPPLGPTSHALPARSWAGGLLKKSAPSLYPFGLPALHARPPSILSTDPVQVRESKMSLSLEDMKDENLRIEAARESPRRRPRPTRRQGQQCSNCLVKKTRTWRKVQIDGESVVLCNACGLWYREKKLMRPRERWIRQQRAHPEDWDDAVRSTAIPSSDYGTGSSSPGCHSPPSDTLHSEDTSFMVDLSSQSGIDDDGATPVDAVIDGTSTDLRSNTITAFPTTVLTDTSNIVCPSTPESKTKRAFRDISSCDSSSSSHALVNLANKENEVTVPLNRADDVAHLFTTPKKPTESVGLGSASTRRWMSRYIHSRPENDVFEAFLRSPSKGSSLMDVELHINVELTASGLSSSPPSDASIFDPEYVIDASEWVLQSPSPRKRQKKV